jgi:Carboxypeptidase regulatory-like domain
MLCAALTMAKAQIATTSLRGVVTDQSGASVPGAKVTVLDPATSYSRTTTASKDGGYEFTQLPPATYQVTVNAKGFKSYEQARLTLLVSTPATMDVKLEVGEMTQTVSVTESSAPAVNTTDATLGNAFGTQQITTLPFDGRDPTQILSLQPGVMYFDTANTNINTNDPNSTQLEDSRSGAVNGARSDQSNITVDGIDNNDQLYGLAFTGALRSTLESTEEFRVTTAAGEADEGRSSGAQVNLVTKSGTNKVHGSLYEYNRNILGRANNWFNKNEESLAGDPNEPGGFVRNVFGGALGGPIKKDRLFFFLNYEGLRQAEAIQTTRAVPSLSLRDGVLIYQCDSPGSCPGGNVQGASGKNYSVPQGFFGLSPAQLASMDMGAVANGTCTAPGHWGPGCGPDPSALALLQSYPMPNTLAGGNGADGINVVGYTFPSPAPVHQNTGILKIDYNINQSGSHKFFARVNYQDDHSYLPEEFPGQPATYVETNGNKGLAFGYTAVFDANHINSLRYGLIRQSLGEDGANNTQHHVIFRGLDDPSAFTRTTATVVPVHNIVDDFTWVKGTHTIQWGGNLRIVDNKRISNNQSFFDAETNAGWLADTGIAGTGTDLDPGAFNFPAVASGFATSYDWAAMDAMGIIPEIDAYYNLTKNGTVLPEGTAVPRHFRAHELEFYLQDSWRIKPNLTINYGTRYTLLQPPYETTGTQVAPTISLNQWFDERESFMKEGEVYNPTLDFALAGQANGKKPYWSWDYKDIGPRLSVAWSPGIWKSLFGGPGKSSIRAGWGLYFDHFGEGLVNTFDRQGSFGLTTYESNFPELTVDNSPRFTNQFTIPQGLYNILASEEPPPTGGARFEPPEGGLAVGWGLDDKIKTPYSHVIDFSIERDLGHQYSIDVAYVGRLGRRLLENEDLAMPLDLMDPKSHMDYFAAATLLSKYARANTPINQIPKIAYWEDFFPTAAGKPSACESQGLVCPPGTYPANPTATQAMYDIYYPNATNETLALQYADTECIPACATVDGHTREFQYYTGQFTSLYTWTNAGYSDYHAMEITLRKEMSGGLLFDLNYTLSKSTDLGSDAERVSLYEGGGFASDIINAWEPQLQHALSDFDATHQVNANWIYQLPFGGGRKFGSGWNHWMDAAFGGWQIAGLWRWTSGLPFNVANGFDFPTDWELAGNANLVGPLPATGTTYTTLPGAANPTINMFKNPVQALQSFGYPFPGQAGQRNILRGPGYFSIDASLQKQWSLGEQRSLRLGWDVYNITNSVRFDAANVLPEIDITDTFGNYTNTLNDSRKMQFSLRFEF